MPRILSFPSLASDQSHSILPSLCLCDGPQKLMSLMHPTLLPSRTGKGHDLPHQLLNPQCHTPCNLLWRAGARIAWAALHCLSVSIWFFYSGETRLTGQYVLVSVLALIFRSLALMTVKQVLGFLFLQALRAEERIVMARSQHMTGEVGTRRHSGGSDDTWTCCGGAEK